MDVSLDSQQTLLLIWFHKTNKKKKVQTVILYSNRVLGSNNKCVSTAKTKTKNKRFNKQEKLITDWWISQYKEHYIIHFCIVSSDSFHIYKTVHAQSALQLMRTLVCTDPLPASRKCFCFKGFSHKCCFITHGSWESLFLILATWVNTLSTNVSSTHWILNTLKSTTNRLPLCICMSLEKCFSSGWCHRLTNKSHGAAVPLKSFPFVYINPHRLLYFLSFGKMLH